jgi:hypothetical protein
METNSPQVVAAFLADVRSAAVISPGILAAQVALGRVVTVPLTEQLLARGRIALLARRGRRLPPTAEALSAALARALSEAAACSGGA